MASDLPSKTWLHLDCGRAAERTFSRIPRVPSVFLPAPGPFIQRGLRRTPRPPSPGKYGRSGRHLHGFIITSAVFRHAIIRTRSRSLLPAFFLRAIAARNCSRSSPATATVFPPRAHFSVFSRASSDPWQIASRQIDKGQDLSEYYSPFRFFRGTASNRVRLSVKVSIFLESGSRVVETREFC